MTNAPTQRHQWVDIAKALGIYLVALGHLDQPDAVSSFLWTFHVPLFFFISGFLAKDTATPVFFKHTLRRLAIPYVLLYILNVAITMVLDHRYDLHDIGTMLAGVAYGTHDYPGFVNAAMWFLPALIIVQIIHQLIIRRYPWAYLPILALSYAIYRSGAINLYMSVDLALLGLNYYLAGILANRFRLTVWLEGRTAVLLGLLLVAGTTTIMAASIGNVWYAGPHYALSLGAGLVGIAMVITGAQLLQSTLARSIWLQRAIVFVSANTLFILCLHQYTLRFGEALLAPLDTLSWGYKSMLITAVAVAVLVPINMLVLAYVPELVGVPRRRANG